MSVFQAGHRRGLPLKRIGCILVVLMLIVPVFPGMVRAQEPASWLEIRMASPAEGETFYTAPQGYLTSIPIAGLVVSHGTSLLPESISLDLQFIDEQGDILETSAFVDEVGHFEVWATVTSPGSPSPIIEVHEADLCPQCHRHGDLTMPAGIAQVVVDARAVRNLRLDRGMFQTLNVQVDGLPTGADAQVIATTRIYDWRRRASFAALDGSQANLNIEALTYGDVTYEVSLVPVVIDGIRYTTPPETLVIKGHDTSLPLLTLTAQPSLGTLRGKIVEGLSSEGIGADVLAVNLATGAAYSTRAAEVSGAFELTDLQITEYALLARAANGFHVPRVVDLADESSAEVVIHLTLGGTERIQGRVTADGMPLPFAQVTAAGLPTVQADPFTGVFELRAVDPVRSLPLEVSAAGYYGVRLDEFEANLDEIVLTMRADTQVIDYGGLRLYIPASSQVTKEGDTLTLVRGVLWTAGAETSSTPFTVNVADYTLRSGGLFAVENLTGKWPRLYVLQGDVQAIRGQTTIPVTAGQTLVLVGDHTVPVDAMPRVGSLLRTVAGPTTRFELAPTPQQSMEAALDQALVAGAKVTMLLAIVITLLMYPALGMGALVYLLHMYRGKKSAHDL